MACNQTTSKICRRTKRDAIYTYCETARVSQGSTVAVAFLSRIFDDEIPGRTACDIVQGHLPKFVQGQSSKDVARKDFGNGAEFLGFR
jgi:hypothetical protein